MGARLPAEPVSGDLRVLASRAAQRTVWPSLLRYAKTSKDSEQRGLAYLVLGYREYEAGEFPVAATDLRQAAQTGFSLADFAEYYEAAAAQKANQLRQVVGTLEGFPSRYPESTLRYEALALLAQALLETNQPDRVIQALSAEPQIRQRPPLALLLARAYLQTQRPQDAVTAFRAVYYGFPTSEESKTAAEFLGQLKARLGADFPSVPEEIQTGRVDKLLKKSHFNEALNEYDALLEARPASRFAERWRIGRARCLLHIKRAGEAIQALTGRAFTDPETDAERLATLVEANARLEDKPAMLKTLDELRNLYPRSPSYASALFSVGGFFARQGYWDTAAHYYQALAEGFPQAEETRDAQWRVAWNYYLQMQSTTDSQDGRKLKVESPRVQNQSQWQDTGEANTRQRDKARQAFVDHVSRYPSSPYVPGALYWLGRLAEDHGEIAEARTYYELLAKRFAHSYYTLQAGRRIRRFPAVPTSSGTSLTEKIPQLEPPPVRCASISSREVLHPFLTLKDLALAGPARQYLKNILAEQPASPDLLLALSQFEAEQGNHSEALFDARRAVPGYSEYEFPALPKMVWDLLYPQLYWNLVKRQARANSLDGYLVMGLIRQESAFNPQATSVADARGLMQMLPQTATAGLRGRRRRTAVRKLYDPAYNIRVSCRYLRKLVREFNGNLEEALAAYNAGDSRVKNWLNHHSFREPAEFVETIPFRETRFYVEAVLRDAVIYRALLTGSARFKKCS